MKSYRCYFLMRGDEPSALTSFIQLKAQNADKAARSAARITGCATVVEVVRVGEAE